jgi:hypothetical protein
MWNDNQITELPNSVFSGLDALTTLHLQNKRIFFIDSNSLAGLVSMQDLDLSSNRITLLPLGFFDAIGLLRTLSLADNSISWVAGNPFQSCTQLASLNMFYNAILRVDVD